MTNIIELTSTQKEIARQLMARARRMLSKFEGVRVITRADHRERRLLIEAIDTFLAQL